MPPSASSKSPRRSPVAPVNAPRAWPNSSDSRRDSGSAPQFCATKRAARRGPLSWSSRAKSSLPVPVSPSNSTLVSAVTTFFASSTARRSPV